VTNVDESDNKSAFYSSNYAKNIIRTIPYYNIFNLEIIDLVKAYRPTPRVWLDTGCGDGALIAKAHLSFHDTRFFIADPSKNMLSEAAKRLKDISREKLTIVGAVGTEDLPADCKGQPEVITAIMAHHYLNNEHRRIATKKCFDVLAAGGIYITFENIRPNSELGLDICLKRWMQFQIMKGKKPEDVRQHASRFDTSYFPIKIVEQLELLNECGFRSCEMFWFSGMQGGFYAIK
jgi:tRNA (cmo5U34)-methyltransferase